MREQFRYMLKTEKIESWCGFELFQLYFLLSITNGYGQAGHLGAFLRVTKIDEILQSTSFIVFLTRCQLR